MTKKAQIDNDVESLYSEFLEEFYDKGELRQSLVLAKRLEKALDHSPEYEGTIRADEIRSLIAELSGDFVLAAQFRESEIRKILQLHSLSVNTPNWDFVSRQYDFSDVSDRLDILATLYDNQGQIDRAISVLNESKQYCEAHKITFDGGEILQELLKAQAQGATKKRASVRRRQASG